MDKARAIKKTNIWLSVWWKTKSQNQGVYSDSTRLTYTGCLGGLEHLKIETRLIDEMFASVMGEYVLLKW
jgi:hypothetical protein